MLRLKALELDLQLAQPREPGHRHRIWSRRMTDHYPVAHLPDAVYERLTAAAETHRRSMNSEAIVCLEAVLMPTKVAPSERLARARELRAALTQRTFLASDIDLAKQQGRP